MVDHYNTVKKYEGNYMLNIAPDKDGVVPEGFYKAVKDFGDYIKNN
ncbi:MAG: alpha-L-fucosidase [Clostridia bacterium]|nr:alpha-L-fucosidase [Clostridia bacterium]